jgi:CHAD domain-containing protein
LKPDRINNYWSKILKQFDERFEDARKDPEDRKAIHDLRTSIKRIKAFLKLAGRINDHFNTKKFYAPWRNLFKAAGQYRTPQVLKDKARKTLAHAGSSVVVSSLCEFPEIKKFKKRLNNKLYERDKNKISESLEEISLKKSLKKYLDDRKNKIQTLINSDTKDRNARLHILRKLLKELSYNLKCLKGYKSLKIPSKALDTWLNTLMDLLGDWHDVKALLSELGKKEPRIKIEKGNIKLIEGLNREKTALLKKINVLCNDQDKILLLMSIDIK